MELKFHRFRNKITGQVIEVPAGRYGNFLRTVRKLTNYIKWNIKKPYFVHLVLTLKEAKVDVDIKDVHRVLQFIAIRLKRQGVDFKYISVKEVQKERLEKYGEEAIHFHVLCVYSKPYVFPTAAEIAKSWRLGNVKITAPKLRLKAKKLMDYIGKYIGKGYEYEALEVKKSFTASQVPQIYKLNDYRLKLIKSFYPNCDHLLKCTFTKVWLESSEYKSLKKIIGFKRVLQSDGSCKSTMIKHKEYVNDRVMIKVFESDWEYFGMTPAEQLPF